MIRYKTQPCAACQGSGKRTISSEGMALVGPGEKTQLHALVDAEGKIVHAAGLHSVQSLDGKHVVHAVFQDGVEVTDVPFRRHALDVAVGEAQEEKPLPVSVPPRPGAGPQSVHLSVPPGVARVHRGDMGLTPEAMREMRPDILQHPPAEGQ